jgi:acetyl esterase/lipase
MHDTVNPGTFRTLAYGLEHDQCGDLYLPARRADLRDGGRRPAVICLLHGGYWRLPYGRDHIAPIAVDLQARGFVVWNLEYRRVGTPGGGWPGTLHDVAAGIDHLGVLAAQGEPLDLERVILVGHSAGGHLALWAAPRARRFRIVAAAGLAPVADLELAFELGSGGGAVAGFIGGSPQQWPARYRDTSPAALLPLGVRQLIVHGTRDEDVPILIGRRYAGAAAAAGDDIRFVELPDAGHMDFVDPTSAAHATVCDWLETCAAPANPCISPAALRRLKA